MTALFRRLRLRFLRAWLGGYTIHRTSKVDRRAIIHTESRGDIAFGPGVKIAPFALLASHGGFIRIGENSTVNPFAVLHGHGGLTIGDGVRIAPHAAILPSNHRFDRRDVPIHRQGSDKKGIVIEDDVWIGAHAVVLDGVTVAEGCVVAAGAVVTTSTQPYGIYAGVPARRIRER